MVSDEYSDVRNIISSEVYRKIVSELVSDIQISVDAEYEEVFARLDSAKIIRSGLDVGRIMEVLSSDREAIKNYSVKKILALSVQKEEQDYPEGEEPDDDEKDVILSIGNYSQGFLLTNIIEYSLAKEGGAKLLDYIKASKIPKAKDYAKQVAGFIGR
jgi:hypothetical protein